jgi:hypothetical protein
VSRALAHRGPALLDVLTKPQELSMPPKVTLEQAYGFGLFVLKAVLTGRGSEVVELAKTNLFAEQRAFAQQIQRSSVAAWRARAVDIVPVGLKLPPAAGLNNSALLSSTP